MTAAIRRRPLRRAKPAAPPKVVAELPLYRTLVTAAMPWPLTLYVTRRPPLVSVLKSDGPGLEVRPGEKLRMEITINTRGVATVEFTGELRAEPERPRRR